jgi:hypothetical protein
LCVIITPEITVVVGKNIEGGHTIEEDHHGSKLDHITLFETDNNIKTTITHPDSSFF